MCHCKDIEFWKLCEFLNVYFHTQMTRAVRFACVRKKVNLNEKSIQIDPRVLPIVNALHVGSLTFNLKLDHLVNSIKKVNQKIVVRTTYLTKWLRFARKKSLCEMLF